MKIHGLRVGAVLVIGVAACSADPDENILNPDSGLAFDTGAVPGPDSGVDAGSDAGPTDAGTVFAPWVRSFGGTQDDMTLGFVLKEDRICLVGTVDAASVSTPSAVDLMGTPLLPRDGQADLFVGCVDYQGELLWARTIGGNNSGNYPSIISTDSGLVVSFEVTGVTSIYPTGSGAATSFSGPGDVGVAKFDFEGELLWARTLGVGAAHATPTIATAPSGDIYVVTSFAGTFAAASLSTAGFTDQDIIVLRLEGLAGDLVWARSYGSTSSDLSAIDQPNAVATDFDGNLYVAGYHSLTVNEEGLSHTAVGTDAFLFSLDADGTARWFQAWDNTNTALQIRTAPSGELYALGDADPSETVDIGGQVLPITDTTDLWIARLNPETGDAIWARVIAVASESLFFSRHFYPWPRLATSSAGDVAISAWTGPMGVSYGDLNVASTGADAPFFLHVDSSGDAIGFQLLNPAISLYVYDLQFGPENTLVVGGVHYSDSKADVTTIVEPLVNNGRADGFVARYRPWE